MSIIDRPAPLAKRNRPRLRLRIRPRPDAVPAVAELPDGRVIATTIPDGTAIDQHAPARFVPSAPIEPPVVEHPEPRPDDIAAALPWYLSAPWSEALDGVFYGGSAPEPGSRMRSSAMALDASEDSERFRD